MNTTILPQIERLLEEGKQEEARKLLRHALSDPLSDEERGALLVGFAAAYLALTTSLNRTRRGTLFEEVEALERMAGLSRAIDEKLQLLKVRSSLHGTDTE